MLSPTIPVGTNPRNVEISPNGQYAYVANQNSGTVSVIDTALALTDPANAVIATITVGAGADTVAFTPDGQFVYVSNSSDGTVSVINTSTRAVVNTITVGAGPDDVAITPDGRYAYALNNTDGTVSVIDTALALTDPTNAVVDTITLGTTARSVEITPDGKYAYLATYVVGGPVVTVIDTATNQVTDTISTSGARAFYAGISPNGKYVYTANGADGTVSVFDTATNTLISTITIGVGTTNLLGVTFTPDGKYVYITDNSTSGGATVPGNVYVIDTALAVSDPASALVNTINVGPGTRPRDTAITPDGKYAFVTNSLANTVSVIDLTSRAPSFVTTALPGGAVGASYTNLIEAYGSTTPDMTLQSGSLPPGLSLGKVGSVWALTGTPTTPGAYTFTLDAGNLSPTRADVTQAFTVRILPAPTLTDPSPNPLAPNTISDLTLTIPLPNPYDGSGTVTVTLPAGATLDATSQTALTAEGCTVAAGGASFSCPLGSLPRSGNNVRFGFKVVADSTITSDQVTVSVTGITGQPDYSYTLTPAYVPVSTLSAAVPTLGDYALAALALLLAGMAFTGLRRTA